jgi:hypothetical protein
MRASQPEVQDLSRLASLEGDALRAVFRRALANLAVRAPERVLPLEGMDPETLLNSVRHALSHGLFYDLSWLSQESAAIALYELMLALPASDARDVLSHEVLERVAHANAATFVPLATALAVGTARGLANDRMRARIAIAIAMPIGLEPRVDALALALVEQPEYARVWLDEPSKGALPARRLAARMLERAALEATRRLSRKDDSGVRVLESPTVRAVWDRLLEDRESLVWRHVAVARGLLASVVPRLLEQIQAAIAPDKTPTEWRRGATSVTASIALLPSQGLALAQQLLASDVLPRDQGVAAAMMFGLSRAGQLQPQVAERLFVPLLRAGGMQTIEAFIEVLQERVGDTFGAGAARYACELIDDALAKPDLLGDDGTVALLEWMRERLTGEGLPSIERTVQDAVEAFVSEGTAPALELANFALKLAEQVVESLTHRDPETCEGRIAIARALLDLDQGLLSGSLLADLTGLGSHADYARGQLHALLERLSGWMFAVEQAPITDADIPHLAMRMRRIRTLLHLVDSDGSYDPERVFVVQRESRRLRATRILLSRGMHEADSPLRRALVACLARTFDALVREGLFELSDVMICASLYLRAPSDIRILGEATMLPELSASLAKLANLAQTTVAESDGVSARKEGIAALHAVVQAMPVFSSARVSVMRWTLLRTHLSLETLYEVRAQSELVDLSGGNALEELSDALQSLAQLVAGARRRLSPNAQISIPSAGLRLRELGTAFEKSVFERAPQFLSEPFAALESCISRELPAPLGTAVLRVLQQLKALPLQSAPGPGIKKEKSARVTMPGTEERNLPAWLPPNRLLGGFYVLHALGEGGVGSVFVARRAEEKDDPKARIFALKVPEYDGKVAQLLSESDFLRMFREEAGALLSLPDSSQNLAGFVTFDAGVKPKPILVMEHVEGPSLERLLSRRHMDVAQAFDILMGVANGLCAMHATGLAHLDLKPSNAILRDFWDGHDPVPVLVDFGLSGRRLRPGCGTPNYAAPEIWGIGSRGDEDPRPADVYAFGCMAYELLTGETLFDADSEMEIVALHTSHDGDPDPVIAMHRDYGLQRLADLISSCLRHDPAQRVTMQDVLHDLPILREELSHEAWPLHASDSYRDAESAR